MEMLFQLRNIEVCLGEKFKLSIPKLDLRQNSICIFMGPNGAGKSTLLRLLAFLIKQDQGEVWFQGQQVNYKKPVLSKLRKRVTLVDQSPYLFTGSVFKNISFGLRVRGIHGNDLKMRIAKVLEIVGLEGFEQRKAQELSVGEAQRIALARALALNTEVLILDEPTTNIDWDSLEKSEKVLQQLPEQGITVIMTTHDEEQLARLGGEVFFINAGHLNTILPIDKFNRAKQEAMETKEWSQALNVREI